MVETQRSFCAGLALRFDVPTWAGEVLLLGLWTGSGPRHTSEYLQAQRKPQEIPERAICLATVPCSREDGDFLDSGMAGVGIIGMWFTALVNYESRCRLIFVFPLFSPLIAGKPPCLPGRWREWLRPRQQPSAPAFERRRRFCGLPGQARATLGECARLPWPASA